MGSIRVDWRDCLPRSHPPRVDPGAQAGRRTEAEDSCVKLDIGRFPLVSARSLSDYKLSILYEPEGRAEERIASAFVHFVRIINFGREPIRREDIAPANPLRIEVRGTRVLDFSVEAVTRPVSRITIDPHVKRDADSTAFIEFDFLDYLDGALVRIMTTERPAEISLTGDIIGMPTGVLPADKLNRHGLLSALGAFLSFALFGVALALTPFVFRWVTGSWDNVWLLALPVVAIVLPLVIIIGISSMVWPKPNVEFPRELMPRLKGLPPYLRHELLAGGPVMVDRFELIYAEADDVDDPDTQEPSP